MKNSKIKNIQGTKTETNTCILKAHSNLRCGLDLEFGFRVPGFGLELELGFRVRVYLTSAFGIWLVECWGSGFGKFNVRIRDMEI